MMEPMSDVEAALATVPVFRTLAPEDPRPLGAVMRLRTYRKGDRINEGTPSDFFYTIATGRR